MIGQLDDGVTSVTKDKQYARIIEVVGKDYTGMDDGLQDQLYQVRQRFFATLPKQCIVFSQTHRRKIERDMGTDAYPVSIASAIARRWAKTFKTSYKTYHYLVVATTTGDTVDVLAELDRKRQGEAIDLYNHLDEYCNEILSELREYKPRLLKTDEHASYWAWMLNGRRCHVRQPKYGLYDDFLTSTDLHWPFGKKYQIYSGESDLYSGWLVIKTPRDRTTAKLINELCRQPVDFSIFQVFSAITKEAGISEVESIRGNIRQFQKHSDVILDELDAVLEGLQSGTFSLLNHRFAIEVFGNSVEELNRNIADIQQVVHSEQYLTARESVNQEPLFWAKFPSMQHLNARVRRPTSENAAHMVTFASVGEGSDVCTWGNQPVTRFRSTSGTDYSFIFHESEDKFALGNTLCVGGSSSGKTTLISFLMSQALKFRDFRCLSFDRLHGMNVFTEFHDGDYLDFADRINLNPFQLPDSNDSRAFLQAWLSMLLNADSDEENIKINDVINQLYTLPKAERVLENIADAFGRKESGSMRQRLEKWLPGGTYETFFNAKRDALDFSRSVITCDMTSVLDHDEILGPLTSYIFYRLFRSARDSGGYIAFIDEAPAYVKNRLFRNWIERLLQEIRKTEGAVILAGQSLDRFFVEGVSQLVKNNIATYVLFPEPKAEKEYYMEGLDLTEQEFEFIKRGGRREVLIKRKGGESAFLNIDLSPLGEYLSVFDSSSDAVAKMNRLKAASGNWKEEFLCE